ncbi:MAG: hypothetical protein R2681_03785 [Pyrinomonadaceae bacterium]
MSGICRRQRNALDHYRLAETRKTYRRRAISGAVSGLVAVTPATVVTDISADHRSIAEWMP